MNPTPEHHGTPIDPLLADLDALLAEEAARAHTPPADLEAKVLALTDPELLSLLDEALAPRAVPDQLADRIIAATSPRPALTLVGTARDEQPADDRPVLARLGGPGWRYAAAAAIVLAAGVGLWLSGQQTGTGDIADRTPGNPTPSDATMLADNQQLFESATASVDATLRTVSDRIEDYASDNDNIWSDMDAYQQFLTDMDPPTEDTNAQPTVDPVA